MWKIDKQYTNWLYSKQKQKAFPGVNYMRKICCKKLEILKHHIYIGYSKRAENTGVSMSGAAARTGDLRQKQKKKNRERNYTGVHKSGDQKQSTGKKKKIGIQGIIENRQPSVCRKIIVNMKKT